MCLGCGPRYQNQISEVGLKINWFRVKGRSPGDRSGGQHVMLICCKSFTRALLFPEAEEKDCGSILDPQIFHILRISSGPHVPSSG